RRTAAAPAPVREPGIGRSLRVPAVLAARKGPLLISLRDDPGPMMTGISGKRLAAIDVQRHAGFDGGLVGDSASSIRMLGSHRDSQQRATTALTPSDRWAGGHLASARSIGPGTVRQHHASIASTFRALRQHSDIGSRFPPGPGVRPAMAVSGGLVEACS